MSGTEDSDPTVPVDPTDELPPPPPAPPPEPPRVAAPPSAWARGDWPLVGLAAVLVVAGVAAASAAYGVLLALATGGGSAAGAGAGLGSILSFGWLGAATRAATTGTDRVLAFETRHLPLGGVLLPVAATWLALRHCRPRLRRPEAAVTFVAKVAVSVSLVVAVLARLVSAGSDSGPLSAHVDAGPAALFALLVVGLTGAAYLVRHGDLRTSGGPRPLLARAVLAGVRAWALAVVFMTALALTAAVVAADSGNERALLVLGAPLVGVNLGVQATSVAMGAAVRLEAVGPAETGGIHPPGAGHLSLLHFGFPPRADAGAAPAAVFLVLALAPLLVAWSVGVELRSRPPAEEQDALAAAFAAAGGFAAAAVAGAVVSRVWLLAVASDLSRPGGMLVAQASAVGTLVLGAAWGLLGGLAAAFAQLARRRSPMVGPGLG